MRLFLRLPVVFRLLGAIVLVAVCYFILGLQSSRAIWENRPYFAAAPDSTLPSIPAETLQTSAEISPTKPILEEIPPVESRPEEIPKNLWYKVGPAGLNDQLRGYTDSCTSQNPTFQAEFLTDNSGDQFVRTHFADRPDIVDGFLAISIPIVKADLLRYLILFQYGGIWNDLDVSCEIPITDWIPEQYKANASIVVGLEFDVDIWIRQFASWTVMAKPKSSHMLTVIEDCLEGLVSKAQELGVGLQDLRPSMIDDIVDVSGPRRLTRGILKSLSKMMAQEIGNEDIARLSQPKLIGDVLVMPDYAFADQMNQQYGDKKIGNILVKHHYAGSWKNENGGERAASK